MEEKNLDLGSENTVGGGAGGRQVDVGRPLGGRTANKVAVDGRGRPPRERGAGGWVSQDWCEGAGALTLEPGDLTHPGHHHLLPAHLGRYLSSLYLRLLKYETVLTRKPTTSGYWEDKISQYVHMR